MKLKMHLDDKGMRNGFIDFKSSNKIAVKNMLDITVSVARKNAIREIEKDFTLRNSFTKKSIWFDKVKTNNISKMDSKMGAGKRAAYMKKQEEGGVRDRKGSVTAIPKKRARQSGSNARPVSMANYMRKIQPNIVHGAHKKSQPSHRAYGVAQMAVAFEKKKFLKRNSNIYRVESFSSKRGRVRVRLTHLYNIQEKPLTIKKETWLEPSIKRPAENMSYTYLNQLERLLKNMKIS